MENTLNVAELVRKIKSEDFKKKVFIGSIVLNVLFITALILTIVISTKLNRNNNDLESRLAETTGIIDTLTEQNQWASDTLKGLKYINKGLREVYNGVRRNTDSLYPISKGLRYSNTRFRETIDKQQRAIEKLRSNNTTIANDVELTGGYIGSALDIVNGWLQDNEDGTE